MTTERKFQILDEIEKQIEDGLDKDGLRKARRRLYRIDTYFEPADLIYKKALLLQAIQDFLV